MAMTRDTRCLTFDDVRVALCETNPILRTAFSTAFYKMNMRNIKICRDTSSLLSMLDFETVDFVVCATDLPGMDFCELAQIVRQKTMGRNPFLLILATVNNGTAKEVRRIANAGVDRVAMKPFSTADIMNMVESMTRKRRPFVATRNYVGPSRRGRKRGTVTVSETIDVPSSIEAKSSEALTDHELCQKIDDCFLALRYQRAENGCIALSRSVTALAAKLTQSGIHADMSQEADKVAALCQEVEDSCAGTCNDHMAELAASLAKLVHGLQRNPNPSSMMNVVQLMQQLAEILQRAGKMAVNAAPAIRNVAQGVRTFAAANSPMIAIKA